MQVLREKINKDLGNSKLFFKYQLRHTQINKTNFLLADLLYQAKIEDNVQ